MADEPEDAGGEEARVKSLADQDKRIDSLEAGQATILGKLEQLLGGKAPAPEPDGKPGSPPPSNIAEEIRQQLDARDAKNQADADARATKDRLAAVEAKTSELGEKQPEPLPRKVERFMGWR